MAVSTSDPMALWLSQLTPQRQCFTWFNRCGWVVLTVTNTGHATAQFRLEATEQTDACRFEIDTPVLRSAITGSLTLPVAAAETVRVLVRVRPRIRPLVGLGQRRYICAFTLMNLDEQVSRQTSLTQLSWSPLIGPILWAAWLVVGCAALIILRPYSAIDSALPHPQFQPQPTPVWPWVQTISALPPAPTPAANNVASALLPVHYDALFQAAAQQHQLDWRILAHLAYRESQLNPLAVGRAGEFGLMQVRPSTWQEWAPKVGVTDPFDPLSNIKVAAAYLAYLKQYFSHQGYGETQWALIAYNWGPGNLQQLLDNGGSWAEIPTATRQYAVDVLQAAPADEPVPPVFNRWIPSLPTCQVYSLAIGQHISVSGSFTETETIAAGPIACRIEPGSCSFKLLVGNLDPTIIFKQEERAPYDAEDRAMHPAMLLRLYRLSQLVQAEWGGAIHLRVTDAYDSLLEHDLGQPDDSRKMSLHFEGRAIDLTTWPVEPGHYGRLCALAACAGFDWVHHEGDHCHAAIKAESLCGQCND